MIKNNIYYIIITDIVNCLTNSNYISNEQLSFNKYPLQLLPEPGYCACEYQDPAYVLGK